MTHGFMTHLIQRSLGAPAQVRSRPVTPFEVDNMKASFGPAPNTSEDPFASDFGRYSSSSEEGDGSRLEQIGTNPPPPRQSIRQETEREPMLPHPASPETEGPEATQPGRSWDHPPARATLPGHQQNDLFTEHSVKEGLTGPMSRTARETEGETRVTDFARTHRFDNRAQNQVTRPAHTREVDSEQHNPVGPTPVESIAAGWRTMHPVNEAIRPPQTAETSGTAAFDAQQQRQPDDRPAQTSAGQSATAIEQSSDVRKPRPYDRRSLLSPRLPPLEAALQAQTASAPEGEPVIHVTIGRVEIRAVTQAADNPEKRAAPTKPTLTLGDYLDRRGGVRK
jgi:hypothetical protein